jgi:hypothetical protein
MTRRLAAIWRILTLPCDQAVRLMSASLDQEVPWSDRIAFRLHAISCRSCRYFFRQIRFIRAASERYRLRPDDSTETSPDDSFALSPEKRQQIDRALRNAEGSDT